MSMTLVEILLTLGAPGLAAAASALGAGLAGDSAGIGSLASTGTASDGVSCAVRASPDSMPTANNSVSPLLMSPESSDTLIAATADRKGR